MWIELEKLDEETVGALVFFYEYLTALTGRMMGINPFDQPGVEQGKKYTYGLMGRAGYEKDAEEVGEWFGKIAADKVESVLVFPQRQRRIYKNLRADVISRAEVFSLQVLKKSVRNLQPDKIAGQVPALFDDVVGLARCIHGSIFAMPKASTIVMNLSPLSFI